MNLCCIIESNINCAVNNSYFMVVTVYTRNTARGAGSRSSMQLQDPDPSAVLIKIVP